MDRAYRRKLTLVAGAMIGLVVAFGIGLVVDYGAMLGAAGAYIGHLVR